MTHTLRGLKSYENHYSLKIISVKSHLQACAF